MVETKPPGRTAAVTLDKYPAVPNPITVEPSCVAKYEVDTKVAKLAVETRFAKLAVDTRFAKLAVETRFAKLAVLINPVVLEIYPAVPKPITVLVRFVVVKAPMILVACIEET